MDEAYTWSAIRYVERNPVSAGMVKRAEDYRWSSAAARCGLVESKLLSPRANLEIDVTQEEWSDWLAMPESLETMKVLGRHTEKGLPCGSNGFITNLEKQVNRVLRFRPQGRPKKG